MPPCGITMHPCPVRKRAWVEVVAMAREARLVAREAAVDDQIAESTPPPSRRLPPLLPKKKMHPVAAVPVVPAVAVVAVGVEGAVVAASALLRVVQAGAHPPRA